MLRRPLVVLGAASVALALAGPALAARVHVRVEGATTTIFGATEPLVTPKVGRIRPPEGPDVHVSRPTVLGALDTASRLGEFYYRIVSSSLGPYVDMVGRYHGAGASGWNYKVNGVSVQVASQDARVKAGDVVVWYWAAFGAKTLRLSTAPGGCYRALVEDDNGHTTVANGVTFRVNSRGVVSASGTFCPTGRWATLRATKKGLVRSQVVANRER